MILQSKMEKILDRLYFMFIFIYVQNMQNMRYKEKYNRLEANKIWQNKHKNIEDCFNKVHNDFDIYSFKNLKKLIHS